MQYIMIRKIHIGNIIDLLKILSYIRNYEHLLIMNARFHSFMMNIEHAMSPTNIVSCPCKSCMANHILFEF